MLKSANRLVQANLKAQQPISTPSSSSMLLKRPFFHQRLVAQGVRAFHTTVDASQKFTHVSEDGKLKMVNVSDKSVTKRTATATGKVVLNPEIIALIRENSIKKGDVIAVAKIAGIMAAKNTDTLIPLCHNIALSSVSIDIEILDDSAALRILATAVAVDKTGVEMEALTAVSVAALTVYDMCKAFSHDIFIEGIQLKEKTGGKSYYKRCDS